MRIESEARIESARESGEYVRGADRRASSKSFRLPERRRGFERRRPTDGTWRVRYHRWLEQYRHDHDTIAAALLVFVVLNIVDLLLTVQALSQGAIEVNPIMAWFFAVDPVMAAVFKLVVGSGVALAVWLARRYRRMLETSLALVAVMTIVLAVHGYHALI
ncbi:MAG: DUF5658 family protein [Acidimicrobiia bacterium]|nr:DUF5658 family protein [Acidimicrobiia bacterium]MDH3398592.1 DUF5658 family protein [Acidimicrobiia bacterium]MDH5616661.1 DUF5658 family protein [Acidimicrobiia bacterium]